MGSDRRSSLTIAEDQTLAEVLETAARELGLYPAADHYNPTFVATYNSVAFYRPEDDYGFAERHVPRHLLSEMTLVDDRGRAIFGVHNLRAVRYRDLLGAADAGVLGGDPRRPYLIIEPGYGDVPPPDWGLALEGLKALRETFGVAGDIGGSLALAKMVVDAVRKRLAKGQEAVENNPEWRLRAYSPYQFTSLILSREWAPRELAVVLGCSEEEAQGVLWVLGFAADEGGTWRLDGDEAARVVRKLQAELAIAAHDRTNDWPADLKRRARKYLETGRLEEPRPIDEEEDGYSVPGLTVGERVDQAIDLVVEAARRLRARQRG